MQHLNPVDPEKHFNFVTNFLAKIFIDSEWPWNILWFDEAHFTLDGAVNSKNCRIWGSARPYAMHECSFGSDNICVWRGFADDFILGPFFL